MNYAVTNDFRVVNLATEKNPMPSWKRFDTAREAYDHAIDDCDAWLRTLERKKWEEVEREQNAALKQPEGGQS